MAVLRLILGDQLSASLSSLRDYASGDVVIMAEVMEEAQYVPHHPKKIAFLFSAMRHFAEDLTRMGMDVRYIRLDDADNPGNLDDVVTLIRQQTGLGALVVTEPGEWRMLEKFRRWQQLFPVEIRDDDRFLCSLDAFRRWAGSRKQLRMEFFYREMRKKHGLLIEPDGNPTGGQWNFDAENRKPPKKGLRSPPRLSHKKDGITRDVLDLVAARFGHHFGVLEPFHFAVTRDQALKEARHFIRNLLPMFGDYQDAMQRGEPWLYHSLLSSYINAGLLLPLELCQMAEAAFRDGKAPLNATEGFIRQILGWREFVRGIYWHHMPDYADMNYFNADRPLPGYYWGAPTRMACIREAVSHTRDHAYSHHIQRLMITGNFALLAGLDPREVCTWYLAVYADAYEWVELPNTLGMALHGDGGIIASKPYAASGKYIRRMSNFCDRCAYDPEETTTPNACPFNALYWAFVARHADRLRRNQRMPYIYASWDKFTPDKQQAIRKKAAIMLDGLDNL